VRDGQEGRPCVVTGPEAVGPDELAALAAELGERPGEVVQVDDDALVAQLVEAGMAQPVARIVVSFPAAARRGLLGGVSSAVQDLTGAPARSLCEVVTSVLAGAASG
jgi:NAD(P)H dehydrogenase (quinone)